MDGFRRLRERLRKDFWLLPFGGFYRSVLFAYFIQKGYELRLDVL